MDFCDALGVGLGALGGSLGLVDHPSRILGDSSGPPWEFLGASGALLGLACGSWGSPWEVLGGSWGLPGSSWDVLGFLGELPVAPWGLFWGLGGVLGRPGRKTETSKNKKTWKKRGNKAIISESAKQQ